MVRATGTLLATQWSVPPSPAPSLVTEGRDPLSSLPPSQCPSVPLPPPVCPQLPRLGALVPVPDQHAVTHRLSGHPKVPRKGSPILLPGFLCRSRPTHPIWAPETSWKGTVDSGGQKLSSRAPSRPAWRCGSRGRGGGCAPAGPGSRRNTSEVRPLPNARPQPLGLSGVPTAWQSQRAPLLRGPHRTQRF